MSLEGRIAVDVGFADSGTATGVQSMKRITLTSTDAYSSGKVAILTGTCGTATSAIAVTPSTYRDADGNIVSFATVTRFAFSASAASVCRESSGVGVVVSASNRVGISDSRTGGTNGFTVASYSGTASYQLAVYGT